MKIPTERDMFNSVYLYFLGIKIRELNAILCFLAGKKRLLPLSLVISRSLLKSRYSFMMAEERLRLYRGLHYQRGEG